MKSAKRVQNRFGNARIVPVNSMLAKIKGDHRGITKKKEETRLFVMDGKRKNEEKPTNISHFLDSHFA